MWVTANGHCNSYSVEGQGYAVIVLLFYDLVRGQVFSENVLL